MLVLIAGPAVQRRRSVFSIPAGIAFESFPAMEVRFYSKSMTFDANHLLKSLKSNILRLSSAMPTTTIHPISDCP